jgi:RNA polymerase sigma-70 factor (ECF subfamily)
VQYPCGGPPGRLCYHDVLLLQLLPAGLLPVRLHDGRQSGSADQVLLTTMNEPTAVADNLWHALGDDLRAFLRSRVPHPADVDDILQDVFVRIVEKIGTLRDAARLESWVYQIARNAIADFYRRRTPQPADAVEAAVDSADGADAAEPGNLNRAVAAWMTSSIDALPDALRDAVRMYELEGVPQAEIARRLGLTLSGAKSRVQRGRQRLEELLRDCCQFELDRRGNVIDCQPAQEGGCRQNSCGCDSGR